MIVPGHTHGNDHGKTAILCPREVNHFRRSLVDHERCTAIMVGSMLLLSVHMPHHSGHGVEDYMKALETVRAALTKGRKAGATDFFVGVDLNIEYRMDSAKDLHGLDSNDWYGMYGPEWCATNYSIITNNKWNVNTHNNMQLTKHDTNDDVDFDNCVVHTVR